MWLAHPFGQSWFRHFRANTSAKGKWTKVNFGLVNGSRLLDHRSSVGPANSKGTMDINKQVISHSMCYPIWVGQGKRKPASWNGPKTLGWSFPLAAVWSDLSHFLVLGRRPFRLLDLYFAFQQVSFVKCVCATPQKNPTACQARVSSPPRRRPARPGGEKTRHR